ncbi:MAG TPA: peptidylprolyl isomerase, partial [Patescibacteria group bacterium]|nr:peptidylprolyl isomerase [Patescibacteria group bacterium]
MTSRTKPTAKRSGRFGNDNRDRHSLYVNLAFGFVILIGVIFLVGAAAATYLGAHFAEAAKVNGQTITEDDVNQRGLVDGFRLNAAEAQLRDQNQLGRITDAELQQRLAVIEQQRQSLSSTTLDRLIDATLQGQLATQKGIAITDADIDQRLVDEATQKEQRHIGTLTIAPEVTTGATDPTDAQKAAAKAAADKALADIKGGKAFEDVAKAVSTDAYAATGGDAGWLVADDQSLDPAVLTAAFALTAPGVTDVVAGDGDTYVIAQVKEIAPPVVDPIWTEKIKDAGIPMDSYRKAVRSDLVRDQLTKKVVADATEQPTAQRQVSEIFISTADYQGPGDEVKVRH